MNVSLLLFAVTKQKDTKYKKLSIYIYTFPGSSSHPQTSYSKRMVNNSTLYETLFEQCIQGKCIINELIIIDYLMLSTLN